MPQDSTRTSPLSSYQVLLIVMFGFILFTIVVDYMTLPALSAILLAELQITTREFGLVVSVYALSAGISGILATGFADSFDRRKLLLVYYGGFLLGMVICATSHSLTALIIGRVVAGTFGGVVASICFAIVADLFKVDQRGRVMGYVQMAFAASLVAGLPLTLYLATNFNWHIPYWIFSGFGFFILIGILLKINPVREHLFVQKRDNLVRHTFRLVKNRDYWTVFLNNIFLVLGDAMFMTFGSAYSTNNLGVRLDDLPLLYGIGGVATLVFSPFLGQLSDRFGKLPVFLVGTALTVILVVTYSNLGNVPLWLVVLLHTLLFVGINSRMIASTALATVVPDRPDRGAFMALDSSLQQVAGGVAAAAAGWIVYQSSDGRIHGYSQLGWVVVTTMVITVGLMIVINRLVRKKG